ncbi:epoxyqueuosine reductase QueH [Thiohalocapsa marina]|uniref:epoxyqueuosine reductase QueH n=1 Tax=Thiohalocapsa marina TaxID=424902 RepID=UPI001FE25D43|nr:epoxyqueuosine reductase QueH [Thiohalocapsa marina]
MGASTATKGDERHDAHRRHRARTAALNPNIHPRSEYQRRKDEAARFTEKLGVSFVDADDDHDDWVEQTRGLEQEPERGRRCTLCFDMRLERTARYAHAHGFPVMATSLGISRWKDQEQVRDCGHRAATQYPGLIYWDCNWRKKRGARGPARGGGSRRRRRDQGAAAPRRTRPWRPSLAGSVPPPA